MEKDEKDKKDEEKDENNKEVINIFKLTYSNYM